MIRWFKKNWFMLGIIGSVALGFIFPSLANLNPGSITSNSIVVLLFMGIGFTLPSEAVREGFTKLRLHLFFQLFVFIIFPLYMLAGTALFSFSPEIRIGLFALAVMPTTVSTGIVLTQAAEGNVVGSMFNAALSNIAGVFISPLLLSFLLQQAGRSMPLSVLGGIILSLVWKMILPLLLGQLFRRRWTSVATQNKKTISTLSNILILIIISLSVAKSASDPSFLANAGNALGAFGFLAVSFYVILALAIGLSGLFSGILGLTDQDRISIAFGTPQKTLAMGVPLLSAYFSDDPALLGIALLPLLFYHPWQILNAGLVSLFPFARRAREAASKK